MNNATDQTIDFFASLNRDGLVTKYIYFHRIKYLSVSEGVDSCGGFIKFKEISSIASLINTSRQNVNRLIKKFVEIGWFIKTRTGYALVGWRKIAKGYGIELKKIRIFENSKKELMTKCAAVFVKRNIQKQIFKDRDCRCLTKGRVNKIVKTLSKEHQYSVSVRTIGTKLGYVSDMTGSRIEKNLEKLGYIKVERNRRAFVCKIEEYPFYLQGHPEMEKRCFVVGTGVYQRLCNNITPLNPDKRVKDFLKQQLMLVKSRNFE